MIGIAAVVLNATVIGKQCLVGAGAVVTERKTFPDRVGDLRLARQGRARGDRGQLERIRGDTMSYVHRGAHYKANLKRIG